MLFYEAVDGAATGGNLSPSKLSELPSPVLPSTGDEGLEQLQVFVYIEPSSVLLFFYHNTLTL